MTRNTHISIVGSGIFGVVLIGGLLWELAIVKALWGFWAAAVALFLFPGTLVLVPWYMLFVYGNWQLLIFIYGGFFLGLIFTCGEIFLGDLIHCLSDRDSDEHADAKNETSESTGEDESEARENRNVNSDLPASIYYVDNTNDSVESQQEQHEVVEATE